MSGHTPGPWVWHCELGEGGELRSAHGTVISHADYEGMWFGRFNNEDAANARLIAAAPELLGALNVLLNHYVSMVNSGDCGNWNPEMDDQVIEARSAIAKATQP